MLTQPDRFQAVSWGERVRAWLTGRHEFRALAEVDPIRAAPLGGRPVSGTTCVEFTHVAYGSRASARLETVAAVRAMLRADLPGARLLAVRDGGAPQPPDPPLRLATGCRPQLMLVGAKTAEDAERLVERVSRIWGLPPGRYTAPRVPRPADLPPLWLLLLGIACAVPLLVLWLGGGPATVDEPALDLLFRSSVSVGVVALATAVALAAVVWVVGMRRGWSRVRRRGAVLLVLVAPAGVVLPAVFVDAVRAVGQRFPAAVMVVLVGFCAAAVPIGLGRVGLPRLWAPLAWGLPLLAGGIAPFVGEPVLDLYLARFGFGRSDLQVSTWAQWALGALVTGAVLLGVYVGVTLWVLGRRFLGPSPVGVVLAVLVAALYAVGAAAIVVASVAARGRLGPDGLPGSLPGLRPVAVCVDPVEQPYSYVGRSAPRPGTAAVYFGRADGRLAVWSAETGGVLLDGQQVVLRVVDHSADCG